MIIVKFTSGLGNQMFQYAFYRLLKMHYPHISIKADITWFNAYNEHHGFELMNVFHHSNNPLFQMDEATVLDILKARGRIPSFIKGKYGFAFEKLRYYPNRIIRIFTEKYFNRHYINAVNADDTDGVYYTVTNLDTRYHWYMEGFWIEEIFYRDSLKDLQKELLFDKVFTRCEKDYVNQTILEEIHKTQSVSIHVRRGDYLKQYAGQFCVLGTDYYKAAVKMIEEKIDNPAYFIFSDDKEFVEKEFGWLPRKTIISNNTGENSFRDMQLMSECKHNITANSTFSTFGALLNRNENHIVIYPKKYLPDRVNEMKTLHGWYMI